MERSLRFWLLFMMTPFFIGMLILFIVPLEFILNLSPRLEESYNSDQIEVEQNIVRAISYLNSRVVSSHLQIYENVRIALTRLLDRAETYQSINLQEVVLNSGAQITQSYLAAHNITQPPDYQKTMWFIQGVESVSQMDPLQYFVYKEYTQVEPYIQAYFQRFSASLDALETFIYYETTEVLFRYPSVSLSPEEEAEVSESLKIPEAEENLNNYIESGNISQQLTYALKDTLKSCTLVFTEGMPFGTVCLDINVLQLVEEISSTLRDVAYDKSSSKFYLLKPIYSISEDQQNPQIIASFQNDNENQIYIPQQPQYFDTTASGIDPALFKAEPASQNYKMNIKRVDRTQTLYTLPIYNYNYAYSSEVSMFLLVANSFEKANLHSADTQRSIFISIIVPSVILLILAISVSSFIMRKLIKELNGYLEKLNQFCGLILKDDIGLEIPSYEGTCDFEELFENLQILNKINKYSEPSYFGGDDSERLIKYLKCVDLLDTLEYRKSGIFQCIGDCYAALNDIKSAIAYMAKGIRISQEHIEKQYGNREAIFQKKTLKTWKPTKRYKEAENNLRRKIFKICTFLSKHRKPGDKKSMKKIELYEEKLMKLSYPNIFNFKYIYVTIIVNLQKIKDKDFSQLQGSLSLLYGLLEDYGTSYEKKETEAEVPPDILMSYFRYIEGCWEMSRGNLLQAYKSLVKGLEGNCFKPDLHLQILQKLENLLFTQHINPGCLRKFHFYSQYQPRKDREYIFLMDVSNPNSGPQAMKKWKNQAKKMLSHIYDHYVQPRDRLFIYEFCRETKITCEAVRKEKQVHIIKKELLSIVKYREQIIYSQVIPSLGEIIARTKLLPNQKYYLVFIKNGLPLNGYRIREVIGDLQAKFLFFYEHGTNSINQSNEAFYLLDIEKTADVDRILQQKLFKEGKKSAYIFE